MNSEGETEEVLSSAMRMMHQSFLNCVCGTHFLREIDERCRLHVQKEPNEGALIFRDFFERACKEVPFEPTRWRKLCVNACHLLINISFLKPHLFCEESARVFCEAALYCYSVGMESQGHRLQQLVVEIICAIKGPIRYYKDDDLLKLTRTSCPFFDAALLSLGFLKPVGVGENVSDVTGVMVDTNQTDDKLLEAIKLTNPMAREAFSRGDFQTSIDLDTVIVKGLNFDTLPGNIKLSAPHLVPLGEIFCRRGIAYLQIGNFEQAVDDFNASTWADIQHYRGYYWKTYALCKLVESGKTELTSRAQSAAAVLQYKFSDSKTDGIHKLQKKFPGLLDRIEYKFVSQVRELKELEKLSEVRNDFANCSLTIILAEGSYDLKKLTLLGGRYYFVCPPGSSASLNCMKGLYLSQGSFLFDNIQLCCTAREKVLPETSEKGVEDVFAAGNLDSLTLGKRDRAKTEAAGGTERESCALIEADDIYSLVINHCDIQGAPCHGLSITFSKASLEQRHVSVKSSFIGCCGGAGLQIQGDANIDIPRQHSR